MKKISRAWKNIWRRNCTSARNTYMAHKNLEKRSHPIPLLNIFYFGIVNIWLSGINGLVRENVRKKCTCFTFFLPRYIEHNKRLPKSVVCIYLWKFLSMPRRSSKSMYLCEKLQRTRDWGFLNPINSHVHRENRLVRAIVLWQFLVFFWRFVHNNFI